MNTSDLKLSIFRQIDNLSDSTLEELYRLFIDFLKKKQQSNEQKQNNFVPPHKLGISFQMKTVQDVLKSNYAPKPFIKQNLIGAWAGEEDIETLLSLRSK
jgi:hypothetical protein